MKKKDEKEITNKTRIITVEKSLRQNHKDFYALI